MPALTQRQELFCESYLVAPNAAEAAREAGYVDEVAAQQASRMLKNPAIQARIAELESDLARRRCRARESLMTKLEAVIGRALQFRHFHAAVRAIELQGRLAGLIADSRGRFVPAAGAGAGAEDRTSPGDGGDAGGLLDAAPRLALPGPVPAGNGRGVKGC